MTFRLACFAAFTLVLATFGMAEEPVLQAGAATSNITPDIGAPLVGGFEPRPSTHVHDELLVRCLAFQKGDTKFAICMVDSTGVSQECYNAARTMIEEKTKWPAENILMAATHTHSAPTGRGKNGLMPSEELTDYQKFIARRITDGVQRAITNLEPARVGWGRFDEPDEVFNRRWFLKPDVEIPNPFGGTDKVRMNPGGMRDKLLKPAGPTDPEVVFLSVQSVEGRPIALLANYSLHYVGGGNSRHVTADYFGMFARKVEHKLGASQTQPPFVAMMSNGTSGNINNNDYSSVRERRQPYEQMNRVAEKLAVKLAKAHETVEFRSDLPIDIRHIELPMKTRKVTPKQIEYAQAILKKTEDAERYHRLERFYASRVLHYKDSPAVVPARLQAMRIGDLGIVSIPLEVFVETGLMIKADTPFAKTFTISHANGSLGYLPTPEHHKLGGYESWYGTSMLEEEASTKIRKQLMKMLNDLHSADE